MKALFTFALVAAACSPAIQNRSDAAAVKTTGAERPTYVLVHGALFTSAGWAPLKAELERGGSRVLTLDLPGREGDGIDPRTITIHSAAAAVCAVVRRETAPIILVGHSQGGAVITQAAGDCGDGVKGLVFVAAVAPHAGEIAFAALNPARDNTFPLCATLDPDAGLFRLNRSGPLEASFFHDLRALDAELADKALASMVSEPAGIGTTPLKFDEARVGSFPRFYIEATQDRVVSIETQREIQARWSFSRVYSHPTSHSAFLSQPAAVADDLRDAAQVALPD